MDMFGLNRQPERDTPLHETSLFMMPKRSVSKKSPLKLLGTQAHDAVEDNRENSRSSNSGTCGPAAEARQLLDPR